MTRNPDTSKRTDIVVVDGSNIATEGRSAPSLAQLNEAVTSFLEEHPGVTATVVVDATFGHRIAKKEVKEFDEAVANNELVAPPAGAIGRGDAFVLSIANKVGARILSNDSFQEFHGDYPWLFDDDRLIGGKPVPNIGWVFVHRVPVQGSRSRRARRRREDEAGDQANRLCRRQPAASGAIDSAAVEAGRWGDEDSTERPRPAASGRAGERHDPVHRVRREAPDRHQRERRGRVVLVARHGTRPSATSGPTSRWR